MGNGTLEITLGNKVVGSLVLSNSLFEELKEGHTLHADSVIAFNLDNADWKSQSNENGTDEFCLTSDEPLKLTLKWD